MGVNCQPSGRFSLLSIESKIYEAIFEDINQIKATHQWYQAQRYVTSSGFEPT